MRPTVAMILFVLFVSLGNSISGNRANASAGIWVGPTTSYIDSGYYNIVGEVANEGDLYLADIAINATFYDENNTVVGTDYNLVMLRVLPPGRRTPFKLRSNDVNQSGKMIRYVLNCTYRITSTIPPQKLEILSNSTDIDNLGQKRIVGEIKNIGTDEATEVKIVATCFNTTGFVVAVDFIPASKVMGPNETSPFEIIIDDQLTPLINRYVLTAESYEYAMIPEFPLGIQFMFILIMPITVAACALKKKQGG